MKLYSSLFTIVLGLSLFGAGCGLTTTVRIPNDNANVAITNTATTEAISYPGQDGKNALELLQQKHTVDVSAEGFVNSIDGQKPSDHQFWAFYINGQSATVGAKDYQAKTNDTIDWKLETF